MARLPRPRMPRPRRPRTPRWRRPRAPRPARARLPSAPAALSTLARAPGAVARDIGDRWLGLSIYTRRRLGLLAVVLGVVVVIALVAVPAFRARRRAGTRARRATTRSAWFPTTRSPTCTSNVDPGSEQYQAAASVAARVPALTQQAIGRLPGQGAGAERRRGRLRPRHRALVRRRGRAGDPPGGGRVPPRRSSSSR